MPWTISYEKISIEMSKTDKWVEGMHITEYRKPKNIKKIKSHLEKTN